MTTTPTARTALVIGGGIAGPIARVLRDLLMPVAMKLLAKPEKMAWQYDYRIDWAAPVDGGAAARPQMTASGSGPA